VSAQPPTTVQVDPDLVRPTWSRAWAGVAVVSLVLCLASLVAFGAGAYAAAFSTLPTYRAATTATVTGVHREHYTDPDYDPCGPSYEFTVAGVRHQGDSPNVAEAYCRFSVGSGIDITYDPQDPDALNAPAEHYASSWGFVHGGLIGAGLFLALAITSVVVAARRKR